MSSTQQVFYCIGYNHKLLDQWSTRVIKGAKHTIALQKYWFENALIYTNVDTH